MCSVSWMRPLPGTCRSTCARRVLGEVLDALPLLRDQLEEVASRQAARCSRTIAASERRRKRVAAMR